MCSCIAKIKPSIIWNLGKFWVKRAKIRHSIAFCEWRRDFEGRLSSRSMEELDDII